MRATTFSLATVALLAGSARAWAAEGHSAVGFVADTLLQGSQTAAIVQSLLPPGWNLNRSATWADEIKLGTQGDYRWASNLHFIDAADTTPLDADATHPIDCKVELPRDAAGGINIVDAIGNFTTQLAPTYPWIRRSEALKFISHFAGDITQPLHTCGKLVGGNTFYVRWNGSDTYIYAGKVSRFQLHVLWDVYIPEKDIADNFGNSLDAYHQWIAASVLPGGIYHEEAPSWFASDKALDWANDANDANCNTVWDPKLLGNNGTYTTNDLSGDYYQANYMYVRKALAKGGYRLAKYLEEKLAGQVLSTSSSISSSTASASASTVASASATATASASASSAAASTKATHTRPAYPTPPTPPTDTSAVTSTDIVIVTPTGTPDDCTTTTPVAPTKPTYAPSYPGGPIDSGAARNSVAAGLVAAAAAGVALIL
ncbi:hypothetical protein HDU87_007005 [Geranomyces variabilis]|uniref:Uncharacterized protein n=1 Tax=Geranomyces variabilis TaxID=109894 RepID=A0AAD5XK12_9FUNG|nr:hypothetical protein HDU87_007005 [Geranomyces variabilis]